MYAMICEMYGYSRNSVVMNSKKTFGSGLSKELLVKDINDLLVHNRMDGNIKMITHKILF